MRTPAQHAASRANGAPRNAVEQPAVEQTCSAIQSFPDGLKCLLHACGALAGKNPRIQALRQPGETKHVNSNPRMHASAQPPAGPAGGPHCAPEPLSMRLRHRNLFIRVHPWPPPPSHGEPGKNPGQPGKNPRKPTRNPPATHRRVPNPGAPRHFFLVHPSDRLDPSATEGITLTT